MSSNPGRVEHGVRGTSVLAQSYLNQKYILLSTLSKMSKPCPKTYMLTWNMVHRDQSTLVMLKILVVDYDASMPCLYTILY